MWSVVIPSNSAYRLRKAVHSILNAHPSLDESRIVVVDDGAFKDWRSDDPNICWVDGVKPFVYARNVNLGVQAAGDDDIVVMGDDVTVTTLGAFDTLAATYRANSPKVGAISPAIVGPVGNPFQERRTSGVVRRSPVELCFVCVYLPRAALLSVGLLDEQFVGYGCEDVDWCIRAKNAGLEFFVNDRVLVNHNEPGMPSAFRTQKDVSEKSKQARELLRAKWPDRRDI